ncbi:MAG: hypothetical protein SGILL_009591, partial [Bacillariaceae sp.]
KFYALDLRHHSRDTRALLLDQLGHSVGLFHLGDCLWCLSDSQGFGVVERSDSTKECCWNRCGAAAHYWPKESHRLGGWHASVHECGRCWCLLSNWQWWIGRRGCVEWRYFSNY